MRKYFYYTCPFCGASLDPGEQCDCQLPPEKADKCEKPFYRHRTENYQSKSKTRIPGAFVRF